MFSTETFGKAFTYPENSTRIKQVRQCADNALQFLCCPDEGSPASRAMQKKREKGRETERERRQSERRQSETGRDF